jgi:hypothetical protein
MRIGIRLGTSGAHAVLTDGARVLAATARAHTRIRKDTLSGLLHTLTDTPHRTAATVDSVTWDISAPLEATLTPPSAGDDTSPAAGPVAALRIMPRSPQGRPRAAHPSPLVTSLATWRGTAVGGHDLFGTELAPLNVEAARACARNAQAVGLTTLAITATGAGVCADHEQRVAARLLEDFPYLRLCLSHEVGGLGLLEREATTVVNAALLDAANDLIEECEQATARALPGTPCWFAGGDGGRIPAKRLRWLPVLGLAASTATALTGAAAMAGRTDAAIALVGADTVVTGRVDDSLPHVEPDLQGHLGVHLTTPQAAVAVHPAGPAPTDTWPGDRHSQVPDVVALLDEAAAARTHHVARAGTSTTVLRPEADLAALGAARTEPSAWLDLLVPVSAPQDLDRIQSQAEQRALDQVATDGPGSEYIVRSVASPVGYLSIYRLQVRAAAHPRTGTDR